MKELFTSTFILLACFILMSFQSIGQTTVSGLVTDDTGEPLIGANILEIGTSNGTITDIDGTYSLTLTSDVAVLRISSTGYESKEVAVGGQSVIDVVLAEGEFLDEIVVIGYGSVKKSDLTGAVSSVSEENFNRGLVSSPDQLIQGKAAGVQIINNSGQPGGSATVRVRGNASIRAGQGPLFVVDGVPLSGKSSKPGANTGDLGASPVSNPLNYLNPSDIESIQVLKDASAAAIYGSRGANGVIIITTKKGRSGDATLEVNASSGVSNILNNYDILTGDEYRSALSAYGLSAGDYGDNVDMFDEILRTGITNNVNLSVNGGNENNSYRVSAGYFNQGGIVKNNNLERFSANINTSFKFLDSKNLGLEIGLIASQTNEEGPPIGTNSGFRGSLIANALQWNPTHRIYNTDGSPVVIPEFGNFTNPVKLLDSYDDQTKTSDILFTVAPSYKLTDNITYKFLYSYNRGVGLREASILGDINIQGVEGRGLAGITEKVLQTQVLTHTLNFDLDLSPSIGLNAVVGYEYQKFDEKEKGVSAQDFSVNSGNLTNFLQNSSTDSRGIFSVANPIQELQSFFGRAIFNINEKFIVTATGRLDGSSKFGENNRYAFFPSIAAAWNIHESSGGNFDVLRLRANWGQTGNSDFDAGASQERWAFGQGSVQLSNVANPDLKWETSTTYGVGLDFGLMDYKLTGTIDYFNKKSTDLLFQFPTIQPAPAGFYWTNLDGSVVNSGVEVALNYNIANSSSFGWDVGINASFISNKLTDYTGPNISYGQLFGQGISGAMIHRLENDQPLNSFYLRNYQGLGDDGQSQFADNEALSYLGNPNPNVLLGISTNFTFGNVVFNMNFNGALGQDVYNNTANTVIPIGNLGSRNIDANLINTGGPQEATSNAIKSSSRYLEDGSYLKLANATLSYNLGNIGKFNNASIYLTGQNLLTFTGYSGFDPEVNTVNDANGLPSFGIEYIPYPTARTFILGIRFGL